MVKIYCKKINNDDYDRHIDVKDSELLDNLPRKSVGEQVESFLLAGQNLELSRRAMFELKDYDLEADIEEYDTGLDEYSDPHDYFTVLNELKAKQREFFLKKKQTLSSSQASTHKEEKGIQQASTEASNKGKEAE